MTIDKRNIIKVEGWEAGDDLEARKLNQPGDVLAAMGGTTPPSQKNSFGSEFEMGMFKVIELGQDIVKCFTWNGVAKGDDIIDIALPFLLRITPFDLGINPNALPRDGITYVYSQFNIRQATNADDDTEDQIIVPSYEEDDIIFAFKGMFGNTAAYFDDPINESPILWVDANLDGRFWAQDDDPPESEGSE